LRTNRTKVKAAKAAFESEFDLYFSYVLTIMPYVNSSRVTHYQAKAVIWVVIDLGFLQNLAVKSQESGVRSQKSKVKSQESGVKSQK
jgi:hypothetical protein